MKLLLYIWLLLLSTVTYAQPRVTYYGDTLKGRVKTVVEVLNPDNYPKKLVYEWNESERYRSIKFYGEDDGYVGVLYVKYNENDSIVEDGLYLGDTCFYDIVKYDKYGNRTKQYSVNNSSPSCDGFSDWINNMITCGFSGDAGKYTRIKQVKSRYDEKGNLLIVKRLFTTVHNTDSTFIAEREYYQYSIVGKKQGMQGYSFTLPDNDTIEIISRNYNADGVLDRESKLNIKKDDGVADTTAFISIYNYDIKGQLIKHIAKEIHNTSGYYDTAIVATLYKYDTRGNQIEKQEIKTNTVLNDTTIEVRAYKYNQQSVKTEQAEYYITKVSGYADTTSLRVYKYDDRGNTIEELEFYKNTSRKKYVWVYEGLKINTRTTYEYDSLNNKLGHITYFSEEGAKYDEEYAGARGFLYQYHSLTTYDSLNRTATYNSYYLHIQKDGTIKKDIEYQRDIPPLSRGQKEYDNMGNVIKETNAGEVILTREIEYY